MVANWRSETSRSPFTPEVVDIAGVSGDGQRHLVEVLAGQRIPRVCGVEALLLLSVAAM
jgi:hypothetical protein